MKNILIPVDFSAYSKYALQHALKLAEGTNTGIHLLYVFEYDLHFNAAFPEFQSAMTAEAARVQSDYSPARQLEELRQESESKLEDFKKLASDSGLMVTTRIMPGRAHKAIIKYAEENGIDLIVMGTHGATGMEELFWGSNAQRIVRTAPCPVLAVKNEPKAGKIKDVLIISDFADEEVVDRFANIKKLQDYLSARLKVLYINTPGEFETTDETEDRILKVLRSNDLGERHLEIYNALTVEDGVIDYCRTHNPDMVVVTTHARKGLRRMVRGNLAEVLVNHLEMPVMAYHTTDE